MTRAVARSVLVASPTIGGLFVVALAAVPVDAADLVLVNGDRLSGDIVSTTDAAITLRHPVLGELVIPRDQVTDVTDPVAEPPEIAEPHDAGDDGLLGSGWLVGWERRLEVGVSGGAGKSDKSLIEIGFTADYEDEQTRWQHKSKYLRDETDGDLADHNAMASLQHDWLHPGSPWYEFIGGRAEWDEFGDWDYRLSTNAGVGYTFIDTGTYRLLGFAGLGANQTFGGTREELTLEGLFGVDVRWKINADQLFTFKNTVLPSLSDTGEFRNLTSAEWRLDLNDAQGLSLKLGINNEYDSLSEGDVDKHDFTYSGALVWSL
jgi:hypothetical protein